MADIPTSCRAALLTGHQQPMEIAEVPIPQELEPGALLVRNTAATICASDVHLWEGESGSSTDRFPRILGHEMTGRVVRISEGAEHDSLGEPLRVGDRIIWTHGFCGQCVYCVIEHEQTLCEHRRGYMQGLATEYPHLTGGFAEYGYVYPSSGRVKVPDIVPDELASAAACALRTMVHGFDRLGRLDDRHALVIQGSGPLGLFSTALASRSGPSKIIVIGGPAARLDVARRWGATHTIDITDVPEAADREALVREWTDGRGPDAVIEVSGAVSAFPEGFSMIRRGGRYLVVGQLHDREVSIKPSEITRKHVRIIGSISASVAHYHRALQFIAHNWERFTWMDMISNRYPIDEINEAMVRMQRWEEIKPAIVFGGSR